MPTNVGFESIVARVVPVVLRGNTPYPRARGPFLYLGRLPAEGCPRSVAFPRFVLGSAAAFSFPGEISRRWGRRRLTNPPSHTFNLNSIMKFVPFPPTLVPVCVDCQLSRCLAICCRHEGPNPLAPPLTAGPGASSSVGDTYRGRAAPSLPYAYR